MLLLLLQISVRDSSISLSRSRPQVRAGDGWNAAVICGEGSHAQMAAIFFYSPPLDSHSHSHSPTPSSSPPRPPLPSSSPTMKMMNAVAIKVNSTRETAFYLWWTYLSLVVVNLSSWWDQLLRRRRRRRQWQGRWWRRRVQTPPSLPETQCQSPHLQKNKNKTTRTRWLFPLCVHPGPLCFLTLWCAKYRSQTHKDCAGGMREMQLQTQTQTCRRQGRDLSDKFILRKYCSEV